MAALAVEPRDYVRAAVRFGGRTVDKVRIRFKGHRAMEGWDGKPAFKLRFNKTKGGHFLGLKNIVLNNMVEDPTMMREVLGYRLYAAAGVVAPRTGYAQVSVNGKPFGLYLLLEGIDEKLLGSGPQYEGEYGCDLYPDDVPGFRRVTGKDPGRKQLTALAKAAAGPMGGLLAVVDRKRFLAYLAVSAFVGDYDGYRQSHNYRIYRDPGSKQWSFIPWGIDRIFIRRLGVYDSGGWLAKRCFGDRACRVEFVRAMNSVIDTFEGLDLSATATKIAGSIKGPMNADLRRPYNASKSNAYHERLLAFLKTRPAEVRKQIDCLDNDKELDRDKDGYGCADCNDADPEVHPGAAERCDGVDRDCSGLADDAPTCACPTKTISGAVFSFCDLPMTWLEAAKFCEDQSSKLAWLDDEEQSEEVQAVASEIDDDDWWIGVSDRAEEGEFSRADGTPADLANWADGEPDVYRCGEDCVALEEDKRGRWRDMHCAYRRPFVCRSGDSD